MNFGRLANRRCTVALMDHADGLAAALPDGGRTSREIGKSSL